MDNPRCFFQGYLPTVVGILPYSGLDLLFAETIKMYLEKSRVGVTDGKLSIIKFNQKFALELTVQNEPIFSWLYRWVKVFTTNLDDEKRLHRFNLAVRFSIENPLATWYYYSIILI